MLEALRATDAHKDTIVIFTSDYGDILGAHGGMHQKWHNAYEETVHVPFIVSGPPVHGGPRKINIPTSHADLLPTLLGLATTPTGRWTSISSTKRPPAMRATGCRARRRALTFCRLLVLRKADFDRFMRDNRDVRLKIHGIAQTRSALNREDPAAAV